MTIITEESLNKKWVTRIHSATISMNDNEIAKVIHEIRMFYWLSEGESVQDKLDSINQKEE